jgi:hypothetical protein
MPQVLDGFAKIHRSDLVTGGDALIERCIMSNST